VRDNLLETAPAKSSTAGSIFVSTGANSIAQRPVLSATVNTQETRTLTTFDDLATTGPQITATTGDKAILMYAAQMANSGANEQCVVGWAVTGASSVAADDDNSLNFEQSSAGNQDVRAADVRRLTGLTAGSNVVTLKYRVTAGTGTFRRRHAILIGL
jgi:hypothetical protein